MLGLGGLMMGLPTGDSQPADLENKWMQKFQDPSVMAGLMAFGANLMKPTWTPGAAMADAVAGAANAYTGVEAEKYKRVKEEEKIAQAAEEKAADRENRLETARIGADSRAEVAGIRAESALHNIMARDELKRKVTENGLTPAEQKLYDREKQRFYKLVENDLTNLGKPIDKTAVEAEADKLAWDRIVAMRARGGGAPGGPPVPGDNSSANPQNGGGPARSPGSPAGPKNTSTNIQNAPSIPDLSKPTAAEFIKQLQDKGIWNPALEADPSRIAGRVRDPEGIAAAIQTLKALRGTSPRGGTQGVLKQLYSE